MKKIILSFLLVVTIITLSIMTFSSSDSGILKSERRLIATFPTFPLKISKRRIKGYFKGIDSFFFDHFPYRSKILNSHIALCKALGENVTMSTFFPGKSNWIFLGNKFNHLIENLQGTHKLSNKVIEKRLKEYIKVYNFAKNYGADFFIFIGPNKSTIYPEFLPPIISPASKRFITPFVTLLEEKGVNVYDPTEDFLKEKEGKLLYYRTDSHWNLYGAYRAFFHFSKWAGLPTLPALSFVDTTPFRSGLLVDLGYTDFPVTKGDTFAIKWKNLTPTIEQDGLFTKPSSTIERGSLFTNPSSTSEKTAWIFGDSFALGLSPFIKATFRNVRFYEHSDFKNKSFSHLQKPDVIIWVIVERDFL